LIGGQTFRIFQVGYDGDLADMIVDRLTWFWREHVEKRRPPPPTTVDDLALLYRDDCGGTVETTPELSRSIAELKDLKATLKAMETRRDELEVAVKLHLKDAATLIDSEGRTLATWKTQRATRLDQGRLKAEEPAVFERFTRESSCRVLRLR
jgi:predicted phage-related endonuclease